MADEGLLISIVSLVISIIAFVVAVAQALQQYAASAEGYKKCQKSVMGNWAECTRRVFVWSEFRFNTIFETPVLFLASPENTRGPIAGRPIYNIDGTLESYRLTRTMSLAQQRDEFEAAARDTTLQKVHTTDDERASWVTLLETIQKAETECKEWDSKRLEPPKRTLPAEPVYTLCVQVQSRRRNWDFMPEAVHRPYATSTISHIAELAVFLGMVWRAFDADTWNLRAEGNGLNMTSSNVQGLGLCVYFSIIGRSTFAEDRKIPCRALKDILFGTVPTITPSQNLNLGSQQDIERTLRMLKCKRGTIEKYFHRRVHVRSISFEIIGMIGQVFRLRGSNFKMIPNPTTDPWSDSLSACTMMEAFQRNLSQLAQKISPSSQMRSIQGSWDKLQRIWKAPEAAIDLEMREKIHSIIDSCTEFLLSCGEASIIFVLREHITAILDDLNDLDSFLSSQDCDTEEEILGYYFEYIRPRITILTANRQNSNLEVPKSPEKRRGSLLPKVNFDMLEDIWITLLFRMCCWWLLHDIVVSDVIMLPPRLKGSRLPVFIA